MKRKALFSIILSVAMILGSTSPAFAAGEMSSDEVTVSTEAPAPESQDEVVTKDDSTTELAHESVDDQETVEEEVKAESESEEGGKGEETPDKESKPEKDSMDSADEEEKPEALVGVEGERVSVGDNVTAGFDSETGTVTFYSQGGTLSREWADELDIIRWEAIKVITISDDSDVMYLPADSTGLFSGLWNLQSLDLSKADTSNVRTMSYMFKLVPVERTTP